MPTATESHWYMTSAGTKYDMPARNGMRPSDATRAPSVTLPIARLDLDASQHLHLGSYTDVSQLCPGHASADT